MFSRSTGAIVLSLLMYSVLPNLAFGSDDDDGDSAKKPSSTIPTTYLDLRTNYVKIPAGTLSLGFASFTPMALLSQLHPSLPSNQGVTLEVPLTVDISDAVSLYGGFTASTSQADGSPWTPFTVTSWNVGVQADIYQQNGGLIPTITVQSTFTRAVPQSPTATTSNTTIVEADYALNEDETRGLLGGVQVTTVSVDSDFAKVNPAVIGYLGAYYQWESNWKLTGRAGLQSFGGASIAGLAQVRSFTGPVVRFDLDRMDDNDNRLFGLTAEIDWTPKPAFLLTLRTPLYLVRN
jgi:hypothetical protein